MVLVVLSGIHDKPLPHLFCWKWHWTTLYATFLVRVIPGVPTIPLPYWSFIHNKKPNRRGWWPNWKTGHHPLRSALCVLGTLPQHIFWENRDALWTSPPPAFSRAGRMTRELELQVKHCKLTFKLWFLWGVSRFLPEHCLTPCRHTTNARMLQP